MRVSQDKGPALISNAGGRVVDIQIGESREAQVMIMNVLTDSLYTNKPEAVWREYGCNAADANTEAGRPDAPIEITLPTVLSPEAVIRDFGNGMSESRVLNVYCKLGESTKRNNDDETGMIGIGAKAGYAYGEMFTVTTFVAGTKYVYQFFKDQGVPRMMCLGQEPSNAPDGTEIRVPVRAADLGLFCAAAEKTFRYFRVAPIVHGGTLEYKQPHSVFSGKDWTLAGDSESVAVMGNVGYKIDARACFDLAYSTPVVSLFQLGVVLHFAIGELDITANREALQYKDGTKNLLVQKATRVLKELAEAFKQHIATAPNLWEAKKAYIESFEKLGNHHRQSIRDLIDNKVAWNGYPIGNGYFDLKTPTNAVLSDKADAVKVYSYSLTYRGRVQTDTNCDSVRPHAGLVIAINDSKVLSMSRVRQYLGAGHSNNREIVVLTFDTPMAKADFWKENKMDGVPVVLLSSLPKLPPQASAAANGGSVHRSKHSAKAFVLNEVNPPSYSRGIRGMVIARSLWWNVEEVDAENGVGVFVTIDKFRVGELEPLDFLAHVKSLRARGLVPDKVYGFKRDSATLGNGWVPLRRHIENKVKGWVAKHAQQLADHAEAVRVDSLLPAALAKRLPDCLAKECIETRIKMHGINSADAALANFIRSETHASRWCPRSLLVLPAPSVNLTELQEKMVQRYPMLRMIEGRMLHSTSEKVLAMLADYIILQENAHNKTGAQQL